MIRKPVKEMNWDELTKSFFELSKHIADIFCTYRILLDGGELETITDSIKYSTVVRDEYLEVIFELGERVKTGKPNG